MKQVRDFARDHEGVEGYLEPKTPLLEQSLLLVAGDGRWARTRVPDRRQAEAMCKKLGIPFYDAAVVGYPERIAEEHRGKRRDLSTEQLEEWFALGPDNETDEGGS